MASAPFAPQFDPRRRIRELLSIPERDRSNAEWDELNELEIQTAPGNRLGNPSSTSAVAYGSAKPGGSLQQKNRLKGKGGGKPGGPGKRPQGSRQGKLHPNKPRPT